MVNLFDLDDYFKKKMLEAVPYKGCRFEACIPTVERVMFIVSEIVRIRNLQNPLPPYICDDNAIHFTFDELTIAYSLFTNPDFLYFAIEDKVYRVDRYFFSDWNRHQFAVMLYFICLKNFHFEQ